jgi:putative OPT family oligopeptide transporter
MSENPSGPASPSSPASFQPYVSPETEMTESTIGAIVLGSILGIVFAATSIYAGLKVGLTTSASIPIAVLSIAIFRAFGRSTILKNNVVQTVGSAGESLSAGVAFTLPSLLLMGFDLDVLRITLIALLGGALGVLMMIPLRHGLMVKEHGKLQYPEGTACAQVLIVGERGAASAKSLFGGLISGGLFALLGQVGHFFGAEPSWTSSFFRGGSISFETNPVLLGTGYIIGWRTSFVMMAGGVLSYLVFIPAIQYFGAEMTSPLVNHGETLARDMSPDDVRTAFVLYIGAGAVATGGLISLLRSLPTIVGAFTRGLSNLGGSGRTPLRTERDLPTSVVVLGCIALVAAIWAPNALFTYAGVGRDVLGVNWLSAILIVIFGFFFVTVSSRITGEIGSSSNPISGMTVATLLVTCLLFVAVHWTGISYKEMALCTAALVCVAASNGGTTSQDLKTGFLVGATPRKQQVAIMWGVLTSSLVIGWTLIKLNEAVTTYAERDFHGLALTPSTQSAYVDALTNGLADPAELAAKRREFAAEFSLSDLHQKFREVEYDVVYVRRDLGLPPGAYLVDGDGHVAYQKKKDTANEYAAKRYPGFRADRNGVAACNALFGRDAATFAAEPLHYHDADFRVLNVSDQCEMVPRGKYLAKAGKVAWLVDPGVCGVEPTQYKPHAPGEKPVPERTVKKFDAPKAQLFRIIIDGVLDGSLPWELVLIGVFLALAMELCGVASLPFAVGAYLPISTSAAIFVGGLARKWADRRTKMSEQEQESSPGVLFSSGLIAGGAICAILVTALNAPIEVPSASGGVEETTWLEQHHLILSHRIFSETETVGDALTRFHLDWLANVTSPPTLATPIWKFFDENNSWGIGCYLALGLLLYLVAARRPRRAATTIAPSGTAPPAT